MKYSDYQNSGPYQKSRQKLRVRLVLTAILATLFLLSGFLGVVGIGQSLFFMIFALFAGLAAAVTLLGSGLSIRELYVLLLAAAVRPNESALRRIAPSAKLHIRDGQVWCIRANNELDAMLAFGYAMGCARGYQMDIARRRASGSLAALLGAAAKSSDEQAVQLALPAAIAELSAALTDRDRLLFSQFALGVNAAPISLEHRLLGKSFAPWQANDCVTSMLTVWWSLCGDNDSHAMRQTMQAALPESLHQFLLDSSSHYGVAADGIELPNKVCDVPVAAIVEVMNLGHALPEQPLVVNAKQNASSLLATDTAEGALLINDLHLALDPAMAPMAIDLHWPEGQLAGVVLAGVPMVVAGSNGSLTWGVTNLSTETRDEHGWRATQPGAVNASLWQLASAKTLQDACHIAEAHGGPPLAFGFINAQNQKAFTVGGLASANKARDHRQLPTPMVVTANNCFTSDDPAQGISNFRWPHRAHRLRSLAEDCKNQSVDLALEQLCSDVCADDLNFYRDRALHALANNQTKLTQLDDASQHLNDWDGSAGADSVGFELIIELRAILLEAMLAPLMTPCLQMDANFRYLWFNADTPARALLLEQPIEYIPASFSSWNEFVCAAAVAASQRMANRSDEEKRWGYVNRLAINAWVPGLSVAMRELLTYDRSWQSGFVDTVKVATPDYGIAARLITRTERDSQLGEPFLAQEVGHLSTSVSMPYAARLNPLSKDFEKALERWLANEAIVLYTTVKKFKG